MDFGALVAEVLQKRLEYYATKTKAALELANAARASQKPNGAASPKGSGRRFLERLREAEAEMQRVC